MASVGSIVVNIIANVAPFHRGITVARGMMSNFVTYATGASALLFGSMASDYEKFNQAVAKATAPIEVTKRELAEMRYEFIELARTSVYSANEIADAFKVFIQAGLNAKQAMAALPVSMAFGQAGDMESIMEATDMLLKSQSALDMVDPDPDKNMQNLKRISDLLTGAQLATTASLEEMGEALQNKAGGAIRAYNLGLEESIALLALFHSAGITGEKAGTAFNIVVRDWTTQFIKHADAWKALGVHVYDTSGKMNSMIGILRQLENAMAGVSDEEKKERLISLGFADRSAAFTAAIMGKSEAFLDLLKKLEKVDDLTEKIAYRNMTEFQRSWADLTASVKNFSESAMPSVFGALNYLIRLVSLAFNAIGNLGKAFGLTSSESARMIARIAVAVTAFTLMAGAIALVTGSLRTLTIVTKAWATVQAFATALSGPWGPFIVGAGVIAATAAVGELNKMYKELDAQLDATVGTAKELDDLSKALKDDMADFMKEIGMDDSGAGPLAGMVTDLDNLKRKASELTTSLRTPFEVMGDSIKEALDLYEKGLITSATYHRAVKKAREDYNLATKKASDTGEPHKAFIRGTTEEFSARFGTARNMLKIAEDELKEIKRCKEELIGIRRALGDRSTVGVWAAP